MKTNVTFCSGKSPFTDREMRMLKEAPEVENIHYVKVLSEIDKEYPEIKKKMERAFSYGYLKGEANAEERIGWEAMACFCNIKAYVNSHEGRLPETYSGLSSWVNSMAEKVGVCHG